MTIHHNQRSGIWPLGLALILCSYFPASSQIVTQKLPEKTRLLFLLDGSASMFGDWERSIKIRVARAILTDLVDSLRGDSKLELALRIYGHNFLPEERNCEDTRLEVPFGTNNHDKIIETIRALEPKGTTPIAYSLIQAAKDFPTSSDYRNIVIIITDGIEACGGDPCQVSLELQKSGVILTPFVIGMNIVGDYRDQFECVGRYFDAEKIRDFRQALNIALVQSLSKTTVTVELLDQNNQPSETNINVSFLNSFTGESVYEFVHYRDKNRVTDTLEIESVLTYDVVANTIPPVRRQDVTIDGGKHNTISIVTPQGQLQIKMPNTQMYPEGVFALIKKTGQNPLLHVQNVKETQKYLIGEYDVEVRTLPPTLFPKTRIEHQETTVLDIAPPGLVNLISSTFIYGSIYQLDNKGLETWIINLDTKNTTTALAMQPGNYKIAFRTKETFGSKYTEVKYFKIGSNVSTNVNLFNR